MKREIKRVAFSFIILSFIVTSIALAQQQKVLGEEWEKRANEFEPPDQIVEAIGLKPGMVIGDIGAGRGRLTVWFADRVGETGKVYANDISEEFLDSLEDRCKKQGFNNVVICLGEVTKTNIPEGALDIAIIVNSYHMMEKPVELIENIIPTLKPTGMLVIVEPDNIKMGRHSGKYVPKEELIKQAEAAGYELVEIKDFLKYDYMYFFKPKNKIT